MPDNFMVLVAKQSGAALLEDNAQWKNRMEIRSETSSRLYIVSQRKTDGSFGCSCMGWKRYRNCKHLDAIVPLIKSAQAAKGVR